MITLYGIKNCDTVKRALTSLKAAGIEHKFHDFKTAGLDADTAQNWLNVLGIDAVINKRGTTWRKLDDARKDELNSENARSLMLENHSLIKRPVIDKNGELRLGFAKKEADEILAWLQS